MTEKPGKSSEEKLSQELGRALEDIYIKTPDMDFEDLAKSYKNIEASFLPKVAGNQFLTLETRRRVAELMLYSATEKECRFDLCPKLFQELSELGFTNTEKKGSVYLIYARYCLDVGRSEEGTRLLEQLEVELEGELRRGDAPVYRKLLETVQDVLRERPR